MLLWLNHRAQYFSCSLFSYSLFLVANKMRQRPLTVLFSISFNCSCPLCYMHAISMVFFFFFTKLLESDKTWHITLCHQHLANTKQKFRSCVGETIVHLTKSLETERISSSQVLLLILGWTITQWQHVLWPDESAWGGRNLYCVIKDIKKKERNKTPPTTTIQTVICNKLRRQSVMV